jgi:hypothetical protein
MSIIKRQPVNYEKHKCTCCKVHAPFKFTVKDLVRLLIYLSTSKIPPAFKAVGAPADIFLKGRISVPFELKSSTNAYATLQFKINDVFDPFATGFSPGGTAWRLQGYRAFRVIKNRIRATICNTETTVPINVAFWFNDTQPATLFTSWSDTINYIEQGFATDSKLISPVSGMDRVGFDFKLHPFDPLGNPLLYFADNGYAGSDSAAPIQTIWGILACWTSDAATFFGSGIHGTIEATFTTHYYSYRPVL